MTYRGIEPSKRGAELRRRLGQLRAGLSAERLPPVPLMPGGLLAHRIYIEAGTAAPDGTEVARHVLSGSAKELAAGLLRLPSARGR